MMLGWLHNGAKRYLDKKGGFNLKVILLDDSTKNQRIFENLDSVFLNDGSLVGMIGPHAKRLATMEKDGEAPDWSFSLIAPDWLEVDKEGFAILDRTYNRVIIE